MRAHPALQVQLGLVLDLLEHVDQRCETCNLGVRSIQTESSLLTVLVGLVIRMILVLTALPT
jgi:hypothetical protein